MARGAIEDQKERIVHVKREDLMRILETNREKHKREYQEALDGYKAQAAQKLTEAATAAAKTLEKRLAAGLVRISEFDPETATSDYISLVDSITVSLKVPRDFSSKYDSAIDMAKWDVREVLELTYPEFECFVRDVWDWSQDFQQVSKMYAVAKTL